MESPPSQKRKRILEACDPCRRKKGRCPGERPVCSYCARLGQTCTYSGNSRTTGRTLLDGINEASTLGTSYSFVPDTEMSNEQFPMWEEKVSSLDEKVTEVLDQVRLLAAAQSRQPPLTASHATGEDHTNMGRELPCQDLTRKAAETYLRFCHCQPLPLFSPTKFVSSLPSRDAELRLCVTGLALRFDPAGRPQLDKKTQYLRYIQSAKTLVMDRIAQGKVELSTLQCLCLLVLSDFNDGKPQQSAVYLSLAVDLARSARLELYARRVLHDPRCEEYGRCLWSIIMLQWLSGDFGAMRVNVDTAFLRYPPSDSTNAMARVNKQGSTSIQDDTQDLGIVAYAIKMTEAWYLVREFVQHRGKSDTHPPWSGQSIYSSIMFRQMDLESQMPQEHRFEPSKFAELSMNDLSMNRHYWAPWLYLQLIYHTIVCTLNHPLLMSIHLRRFRVNQIPELFLQHTADLTSSHTDWIIHLLEVVREKGFHLTDPFLGQCIAIVATIFLQQSYTEKQNIRQEKQGKFATCLRVVQYLGRYWSHIDEMGVDLQNFESTLSKAYESSTTEHSPNLSKFVDLTAFWKILDNTLVAATSKGSRSIFGPSLRLQYTSKGENELLSTRLMPEPTRVQTLPHATGSAPSTPNANHEHDPRQGHVDKNMSQGSLNYGIDSFADTPFLTENFFALGQDFVGNADDWFNWTEM